MGLWRMVRQLWRDYRNFGIAEVGAMEERMKRQTELLKKLAVASQTLDTEIIKHKDALVRAAQKHRDPRDPRTAEAIRGSEELKKLVSKVNPLVVMKEMEERGINEDEMMAAFEDEYSDSPPGPESDRHARVRAIWNEIIYRHVPREGVERVRDDVFGAARRELGGADVELRRLVKEGKELMAEFEGDLKEWGVDPADIYRESTEAERAELERMANDPKLLSETKAQIDALTRSASSASTPQQPT